MLRLRDTTSIANLMEVEGDTIKTELGEPSLTERVTSGQEVLTAVLQVMKALNATTYVSGLKEGELVEDFPLETVPTVVPVGNYDPIGAVDALGDLIVVLKGSSLGLGLCADDQFGGGELEDTAVIREFMVAVGQSVLEQPLLDPSGQLLALRAILVLEEGFELLEEGLGLGIQIGDGVMVPDAKSVRVVIDTEASYDPQVALRAVVEAVIAVKKAGLRLGLPVDNAVIDQIGPSNLSKLQEDGTALLREDGKVMKSDRYFVADFQAVLEAAGYPL